MESVGAYLKAVWDLGRKSMRPALPALAFLYFYRVGVGAYTAVAGRAAVLSSTSMADILPRLAVVASLLPILVLIYTPMLPLQDALLQGRPISFLAAVRRVLEAAWALTLSGIVQGFALLLPFMILCVAAALVIPTTPGDALDSSRLVMVAAVAFLGLFGMFVVGLVLMFATPALVLDNEGPLQSIGTSFRLVFGHMGTVLGRIFAFLFISIAALIGLTMPTQILSQVSAISGGPAFPMKMAMVIWSSAIATLYFPFGVASLTVLYRTLVPTPGNARGAPVLQEEEFRPTTARVPFE